MTRSRVFLAALGTRLGSVGALSTAQSSSTPASSSHAPGVAGRAPEQHRFKSGEKLTRALEAARLFAGLLGPDQLEIIAFNHPAGRVHAFGDDHAGPRARPDAGRDTREAFIVLSDGEDTASLVGFDEGLPAVRRSRALVYTISLRESADGEWIGASWPLLNGSRQRVSGAQP